MSLEDQLQMLNNNLEMLNKTLHILSMTQARAVAAADPTEGRYVEQPDESEKRKKRTAKTEALLPPEEEPEYAEPDPVDPDPVDPTDQPEDDEVNVTKESLGEKLKELIIKTDRAAIMKVFEPFGVSSLSALPEDQYAKMDIALTKALNRARG